MGHPFCDTVNESVRTPDSELQYGGRARIFGKVDLDPHDGSSAPASVYSTVPASLTRVPPPSTKAVSADSSPGDSTSGMGR
jgi:hypothetical protein